MLISQSWRETGNRKQESGGEGVALSLHTVNLSLHIRMGVMIF